MSRPAGVCFSAAEASGFAYVRSVAVINGTTCPMSGTIVGVLLHMDAGCIRTRVFFCGP